MLVLCNTWINLWSFQCLDFHYIWWNKTNICLIIFNIFFFGNSDHDIHNIQGLFVYDSPSILRSPNLINFISDTPKILESKNSDSKSNSYLLQNFVVSIQKKILYTWGLTRGLLQYWNDFFYINVCSNSELWITKIPLDTFLRNFQLTWHLQKSQFRW